MQIKRGNISCSNKSVNILSFLPVLDTDILNPIFQLSQLSYVQWK
jgi:hypothetical protein